jgi:hypothetical protein
MNREDHVMNQRTLAPFLFFLLAAPLLDAQNQGAEKTKLPVRASIEGNKSLRPDYKIGNVRVTYSDGTTDLWTLKGNCAEPKVSTKGSVGWEVYKLDADGKTLANYNGLYVNNRVNVCDHGRVVANLESAKGFIEGWDFTKDGERLVIKSRGAHGPATIELFSLRNGSVIEAVQAYEKNLPDWAASFADAE